MLHAPKFAHWALGLCGLGSMPVHYAQCSFMLWTHIPFSMLLAESLWGSVPWTPYSLLTLHALGSNLYALLTQLCVLYSRLSDFHLGALGSYTMLFAPSFILCTIDSKMPVTGALCSWIQVPGFEHQVLALSWSCGALDSKMQGFRPPCSRFRIPCFVHCNPSSGLLVSRILYSCCIHCACEFCYILAQHAPYF